MSREKENVSIAMRVHPIPRIYAGCAGRNDRLPKNENGGPLSALRQGIIDSPLRGGSAAGQGHPVLSTGSGDRFQGPAGWDLKGF